MSFIGWILIGLIMGAIARAILPGKAAGGWIVTLIVGVLGALLGGWIGGAWRSSSSGSTRAALKTKGSSEP